MSLPGFDLQAVYLDVGWGIVLASIAVSLFERPHLRHLRPARRVKIVLLASACIGSMWLPPPFSPSFWLGMSFQYPSLMLVTLMTFYLVGRLAYPLRITSVLSTRPAASLVALGIVLYGGVFLWVPIDLYAVGYGRFSAVLIATVLVLVWCRDGIASGTACAAVALAALTHATTRLPTGNAWDAVLDPLLFIWSAAVVVTALRRRWRDRASLAEAAP